MRRDFKDVLHEEMLTNEDIWVLTGDLGYGMWDKIRDDFPKRFINTGAAETTLLNIAVGLAIEGKIPVAYSITPFLLYRPFEVIRTYINHEKIPVIMVGGGRGSDYKHDGFSHFAGDDIDFMQHFQNIESCWPQESSEMRIDLKFALRSRKPTYINLTR